MSDVIDIHPHVISPDTDSFPLKPLGGTQSSWSLKHPLTYDELIAVHGCCRHCESSCRSGFYRIWT
jgi:hypothetical protein